jgi:hypothetical protein
MQKSTSENKFPVRIEESEEFKTITNYIEEAKKLLSELEKIVKIEDKNIVKNYIDDLERIKVEMIRGLYFVTIQGSLKTGKSTLTNILVGEEVAITASGFDTTRIPYVITKSTDNKAKIVLYKLRDNIGVKTGNPEEEIEKKIKEIIRSIIDDIKGLDIVSDKKFIKKEKPFDKKIVEEYTVFNNDNSVLLVNIQIPKPKNKENWILDYDIGILDTPGVEGEKAYNHKPEISEIRKRTNMLVIMQSTVTPLNKIEIEELKNYKKGNISSVRLLHNKFDLFHWREEEDLEEFNTNEKKSIEKTHKRIKSIFGKTFSRSINLAKVNDYMKLGDKYPELKSDYDEFVSFESDIIEAINTKKAVEKKEKAVNDLKSKIEEIIDENEILNQMIKEYEKIKKELENEKIDITNKFDNFYENLNKIPEKILELKQILKTELDLNKMYLKEFISYDDRVKKLPIFDTLFAEDIVNKIKASLNYKDKEIKDYLENKFLKNIQEILNKYLQNDIETVNEILNKLNLMKIDEFKFPKIKLPQLRISYLKDEDIKKCIKLGKKDDWSISYAVDIDKTENSLVKRLQEDFDSIVNRFLRSLKGNLEREIEEYENVIKQKQKEVETAFQKNNLKTLNQAENVVTTFSDIKYKLKDLKNII